MFPLVITQSTSRALIFCLAFINFFLVNCLVCRFPYSVYDLFSGPCCFLFDLSRLPSCCLVYRFFFGGILWFLSRCRCWFGGFSFLGYSTEGVPSELSSFLEIFLIFNCIGKCFQHSLSSMYSCCIDIRLMASSGTWSSTIFLKAIPVTFAQLFLLSICCRNSSMSPLYLIWYSSRRALTSSWVGPNRRMTCYLNISHWSYPSCLVYPSTPVIWFSYAIANWVNVAPCIFPRAYLILSPSSLHCNLFRAQ